MEIMNLQMKDDSKIEKEIQIIKHSEKEQNLQCTDFMGHLQKCLVLHIRNMIQNLSLVTHPIRSGKKGNLRVPSAKECHWAGPRKKAFSDIAPSLWNIIP